MNEELTRLSMTNLRGTSNEEHAKDRSAPPSRWILRLFFSLKLLTAWMLLGTASVGGIDEQASSSSAPHRCHENRAMAVRTERICLSDARDAGVASEQLRLCKAQQRVESLVFSIASQHAAIANSREQLKEQYLLQGNDDLLAQAWRLLAYGMVWSYRQIGSVDDYWRIGSMESTLLVAYSKLRASRASFTADDRSDLCPLQATGLR